MRKSRTKRQKRTKDKRNIAGKRWKIDEMDRKGLKWEEGEKERNKCERGEERGK